MSKELPLPDPTYLGDGVYAMFDGYQIWIWTSDGFKESQKIAIENSVLVALNKYAVRIRDHYESLKDTKNDENPA